MAKHGRGRVIAQGQSKEFQNTWTPAKSEDAAAVAETIAHPVAVSLGCAGVAISREVGRSFEPRAGVWAVVVRLTYKDGTVLEVDRRTDQVTVIRKGAKK